MAEAIINFSDLIGADSSFDELDARIEQSKQNVIKTAKELQGVLNVTDPRETEQIAKLNKEISVLRRSLSTLEKARKTNNDNKKRSAELTQKEITALADEREQLRRNRAEQRAIAKLKATTAGSIENLRARLSVVTIEWAKLTKEERENSVRGQRLVRVKKELTEELKREESATGDTRRSVGDYREQVKLAIRDLQEERRELSKGVKELREQRSELRKGSAEWIQYSKRIEDAEKRLKSVNGELGEVDLVPDSGGGRLQEGLGGVLDNIDIPTGGGVAGDISSSLGGIAAGFGPVGIAVGAVLAGITAVGVAVFNLDKEFEKLRGTIQRTTGATGVELDEITTNTLALQDVFGEDQDELIRSQNVLIKEFGITAGEAFEIIESGFLSGANAQGDLLDSIQEYSSQIKAAGGDAGDLINILDRSGRQGVFSDKGIDAVKEFGLRIREQTSATTKALQGAFGNEFTDRILKGISDGSISTLEALEEVSQGLNDTTIPAQKVQTVIADVFGGPGEDAGLEFLKTLTDITGETNNLVDATNPLVRAQKEQLELQKSIAVEQNNLSKEFAGTASTLETLGLQIQNGVFNQLRRLVDRAKGTGEAISNAFEGIATGNAELITASNKQLLKQTPIIGDLIGGYIELTEAERKATSQSRVANEVTEVATGLIQDEIFEINNKLTALDDENITQEERIELLQDLKDEYPQYIDFLIDEEGNVKDIEEARKAMNKAIIESAVARAKEAIIATKIQSIIDNELELIRKRREAAQEGAGTTALEIVTLGRFESAQDRVDSIEDTIQSTKDDLATLGTTLQSVEDELNAAFAGVDLAGGFNSVNDELTTAKEEFDEISETIEDINRQLKSDSLSDSVRTQLEETRAGLLLQLDALGATTDQLKKAQRELLELGGTQVDSSDRNLQGSGGLGTGRTRQREAKELDLLEKIRRKRNEISDEGLEREIEAINIRIDSEIKGFEKLRAETVKFRNEGLISIDEFNRRIGEINTISELAERERQIAINRIQSEFIAKEIQERVEATRKVIENEIALREIQLRNSGASEEQIEREKSEARLNILRDELNIRREEQEKINDEVQELEGLDTLTPEQENRLEVLRNTKDLSQEILALELELTQEISKQNQIRINQQAGLDRAILQGDIDENERRIEDQRKLIEELGHDATKAELDELRRLIDLRFELRKQGLINEFDLQLALLEEGSLEYQRVEQEKNNALAKLNKEYADEVDGINQSIIDNQKDQFEALVDDIKGVLTDILSSVEEVFERSVENAEDRLDKQNDLVDRQRERAEQGLSNTLAFEQREAAEREQELIAAQRRLENVQKVRALYASYTANSSNSNVQNPLQKTLRDFAILEAISRSLQGFSQGGYTGDYGVNEVSGLVHGREFVLDAPTTKEWGLTGLSMQQAKDKIQSQFMMPKSLLLRNNTFDQYEALKPLLGSQGNNQAANEVKMLRRYIENNPPPKLEWNKLGDDILEFVETTETDGLRTINRRRIKKRG